jgi:hypothetical protein
MQDEQGESQKEAAKRFNPTELEAFDPARREVLRRLLVGAVFVVPVVSSFSIDALLLSPARAQTATQQVPRWACISLLGTNIGYVRAPDEQLAKVRCPANTDRVEEVSNSKE